MRHLMMKGFDKISSWTWNHLGPGLIYWRSDLGKKGHSDSHNWKCIESFSSLIIDKIGEKMQMTIFLGTFISWLLQAKETVLLWTWCDTKIINLCANQTIIIIQSGAQQDESSINSPNFDIRETLRKKAIMWGKFPHGPIPPFWNTLCAS